MGEADKLFKKLGYKGPFEMGSMDCVHNYEDELFYYLTFDGQCIVFYKDHTVSAYPAFEDDKVCALDVNDIKAIILKMKELGWIVDESMGKEKENGRK